MNALDLPAGPSAAGTLGWTLERVALACDGVLVGDADLVVEGVTTDSRRAAPGSLFVAIEGERADGHDFADAAISSGAVAALVEPGRGTVEPRIEVENVLGALLALAISRRGELQGTVVAVTGSTGKTSTKDLLAAALGPDTWAAHRSFNNEVGVPLTILGAPIDSPFLAVEVGSRGSGDIARLAPAVAPDVAIITGLGVVHLETFGTPEALAAAKWELVEALGPHGTAVLPYGESRLPVRAGPVLTFGTVAEADVYYRALALDDDGRPSFEICYRDLRMPVTLKASGAHMAANACAATAAAIAAGIDPAVAAGRLEQAVSSPWRMEVHAGRFTVVNDAYNSNPTSLESALRTVAAMPGNRVAVLGPMAELGEVSVEEHRRLGALAVELGFGPIIIVGPDGGYAAGAGAAVVEAADAAAALRTVLGVIEDGDAVLVKGSRVAGLEVLALRLAEEAEL